LKSSSTLRPLRQRPPQRQLPIEQDCLPTHTIRFIFGMPKQSPQPCGSAVSAFQWPLLCANSMQRAYRIKFCRPTASLFSCRSTSPPLRSQWWMAASTGGLLRSRSARMDRGWLKRHGPCHTRLRCSFLLRRRQIACCRR
jgi:hypothetical protein